jgi:hypothetical protein
MLKGCIYLVLEEINVGCSWSRAQLLRQRPINNLCKSGITQLLQETVMCHFGKKTK